MNGKIVAAVIIIVIAISAFSGIAYFNPQFLSKFSLYGQAPLSVSQVNLQPGGKLQNNYLINSFWDVNLAVNSIQNVAFLKMDHTGVNGTSFSGNVVNGETLVPSAQVYVTLKPLQPYATVPLRQIQITWAQSASGFGDTLKVVPPCGQCFFGSSNSTTAQTNYFFEPSEQYWTFHYPVQITVKKIGGNDSFTATQTIDMVHQNSVTIVNPNASDENVTINQIGFYSGALSQVPVGSPLFYDGGSKCSGMCGFTNAQTAVSQYQEYWFGTQTSFNSQNGATQQQAQYYDGSCTHPGWGQSVGYASAFGFTTTIGYFYFPVTPSLTTPTPALNSTSDDGTIVAHYYSTNQICRGLDLTDWLYASPDPSVQPYTNPYGSNLEWTVNQSQLTIDLPYSTFAPLLIPAMQVLVSTSLADTTVYQVNNAQFKIVGVTSTSASITSGASTSVTVQVKNTGDYAGTATVSSSQSLGRFAFSPPSQSLNLNPGQTGTLTFTANALFTSQCSSDSVSFYVSNSAGQVTDSKAISLTDCPAPSLGTKEFVISSIKAPQTLATGKQATVEVDVQSLGAAGIAYLSASSEDNGIAVIAPSTYNQSMGAGNTVPIQFTIAAVALPQGVTAKNITFLISVENGTSSAVDKLTVEITSGNAGPCLVNCTPPPGGGLPWIEIIGIVLIVIAAVAVAYVAISKWRD